ncbi:MAG: endonuclease III [Betaproteobacteria bacterium]|nr:endonuclease III [Betaproteobacteria bacterium]
MNAEKRAEIFRRLHAINPNPTTELEYQTPFELLVAVLLSAQATDVSVNAATRRLFPRANTPQKIAKLGVAGVEPFIKTIGLYRTKAKHLIKTCELLIAHHGGAVPENREALEALPGVGRKTANVVLNTAFGWSSIAVDTHIFRVANRTKIGPGKTVMEVEKRLERLVPDVYKRNAHHWLILHGRYICKARKPECWRCPINDLCEFRTKTLPPD